MRPSTFVAAFAATAFAGPVVLKRAYVTELSYKTVTKTVTAGADQPVETVHVTKGGDNNDNNDNNDNGQSYGPPQPAKQPQYQPPKPQPAPSKEQSDSNNAPAETSKQAQQPAYTPPAAPSSSSTQASAPASTPSQDDSNSNEYDLSTYHGTVLYYHNQHRANHSSPGLAWNQSLAVAAGKLAEQCIFNHNVNIDGGGYGQNLAANSGQPNVASQISNMWYNGEADKFTPYYGIANPQVSDKIFESYGHFTQMVWKDTQTVGCATYDCRGKALGMWYTVCNYAPCGNVAEQYATNVQKPEGHSILDVASKDLSQAVYAAASQL